MANFTSAANVAAFLGVTFTSPQTTQATALLNAADAAIQAYTDRVWGGTAIVGEVYQPEGPFLQLRQRPVASIQSVVARWYFGATVTLVSGTDYLQRDLSRGLLLLTPWRTGRPTDRPYETLEVSYTPVATVPADVVQAATMLVAAWMQPTLAADGNAETAGAILRRKVGDVEEQYAASSVAVAGNTLPAAVQALLAPYRAALTFA